MIRNYRDLQIWQKGMDLVGLIYDFSAKLLADERFGLKSQITRAAVSIPSNISEGYVKRSDKEKLKFFDTAIGSMAELDTQLEICLRRKFIVKQEYDILNDAIIQLKKMTYSFTKTLREKLN